MSNLPDVMVKDNNYSDLTDQELNSRIQYIERPMLAPLQSWMAPPTNGQQSPYYNSNENGSFLSTPPSYNSTRHHIPPESTFTNHEFVTNNTNAPVNYNPQGYSPSPSPPRYRQSSVASDSSNPYNELEEQPTRLNRNHAGDCSTGGTKMTVNKRDKALERNRQAALRCRQRKKEWLNQLQSNVDLLRKENRALEQQSLTLREEILNLKTVLLAHRDCSHAHLTASSINLDNLLYRSSNNSNSAVVTNTSPHASSL
ncbi:hypothetical protein [Parasitella parasitica]|uniref:BZIP domain-containing protein n=1 Tax=Parasitella parasitica TaxID=35722 RepID=A0A0B7NXJ6_9FUNG|nr:hypothetical protein [Parasitella parasitica]